MYKNIRSLHPIHWIALLLISSSTVCAQEICTNGVDDDGDNLIDLNDSDDCICSSVTSPVSSLIPNPSFENYDCVPSTFGELYCAETWEQATFATSDFFLNIPGGFWDPIIPTPLPDGQGIGGFIISAYPSKIGSTDALMYNEYIGGCLLAPMEAGVEYTIQMDLAGSSWDGLSSSGAFYGPIDITIFGSTSCPEWPIDVDPNAIDLGCPTVLSDWVELGHTSYQADETWQTITISFTPEADVQAVMIGGPCEVPDDFFVDFINTQNYPYFWIDNLLLNESSLFSTIATEGGYCSEDLTLVGESDSLATLYQWYYEGVALPGQTDNTLDWSDLNLNTGDYQFIAFQNDTLCTGSEIQISLPNSITPTIEASTQFGCEPLTVLFENTTPTPSTACEWDFGDGNSSDSCSVTYVFDESGVYSIGISVTLENGCTYDTTYQQYIEVIDLPQAIFTASPQPTNVNDTEISFFPEGDDIVQWLWDFGDVDPFTSTEEFPIVNYPATPGNYPVQLIVFNSAGCTDTLQFSLFIDSDGTATLPNVFSPDGDGYNEVFRPFEQFPGKWTLTIFNRWGSEIYTTQSIQQGWSGGNFPEGTYYWVMSPRDGQTGESKAGHVTLVR
jgi:gliding motility-associated-like protein